MPRGPRDFPAGPNPRVVRAAEIGFVPRRAEIYGFSEGPRSIPEADGCPSSTELHQKGSFSFFRAAWRSPFAFHLYLYELLMSLLGVLRIE